MTSTSHRKSTQCFLRVSPAESVTASISPGVEKKFDKCFLEKEGPGEFYSNQIFNDLRSGISGIFFLTGESGTEMSQTLVGVTKKKGGIIRNAVLKLLSENIITKLESYEFFCKRAGSSFESSVFDIVAKSYVKENVYPGYYMPFPGQKFCLSPEDKKKSDRLDEIVASISERMKTNTFLQNQVLVRLSIDRNSASAFIFMINDEFSRKETQNALEGQHSSENNISVHSFTKWLHDRSRGEKVAATGTARTHALASALGWAFEEGGGNGKFLIFVNGGGQKDPNKAAARLVKQCKTFEDIQVREGIFVHSVLDSSFRFAVHGEDEPRTLQLMEEASNFDYQDAKNTFLSLFRNVSAPVEVKETYFKEYIDSLSIFHRAGFRSTEQLKTKYGYEVAKENNMEKLWKIVFLGEADKHTTGIRRVMLRENSTIIRTLVARAKKDNPDMTEDELIQKKNTFLAFCENSVVDGLLRAVEDVKKASEAFSQNPENNEVMKTLSDAILDCNEIAIQFFEDFEKKN